ncbi:MAG: hypothetical protein J6D36_09000 [Erysipelotrichaceae bacterium]|nr:hypothetical protein [Erysipelotrichaceae bacterium]
MKQSNKNHPGGLLDALLFFFKFIYSKLNDIFDIMIFNKWGSVMISLLVSIMICVTINYNDVSKQIFKTVTATIEVDHIKPNVKLDEDQYVVSGIPEEVNVSLSGSATDIQIFRNQGNISVSVDLSDCVEGQNIVDFKVDNLPSSLSATVDPASATVVLEKKVSKEFTVTSELLLDADQDASDFEKPTLPQTKVIVTGSQSEIDSIRTVKAIVDAGGQTGDFEFSAALAAYDEKGASVDVAIEPSTMIVEVRKKAAHDAD